MQLVCICLHMHAGCCSGHFSVSECLMDVCITGRGPKLRPSLKLALSLNRANQLQIKGNLGKKGKHTVQCLSVSDLSNLFFCSLNLNVLPVRKAALQVILQPKQNLLTNYRNWLKDREALWKKNM